MRLELTPEQQGLRKELRAYFEAMMTPAVEEEMARHEMGGPLSKELAQRMGADGWLGIGWPVEVGGQGRTALEQYIFASEVQRARFPLPFLTLDTVGPTLFQYGTEEQRRTVVPRILGGECVIAIGYSEPGAGTDLAALTTRAERDGDEWVINGQKVFTSLADFADYVWLAARTDPKAPKHKGLSIFLVPTDEPGFSVSPIFTLGDVRTNATFYENVRLPASALIGGENRGWGLITSQLNRERVSLLCHGPAEALYEDVVSFARSAKLADGRRVIDQPFVQRNLARVRCGVEAMKLLSWKQAWAITRGELHPADASATKVFGSEFLVEAYRLLLEVMGQAGILKRGSPEAALEGRLERQYRTATILTFGGGTNEIQRDIVAAAGLGMPRDAR